MQTVDEIVNAAITLHPTEQMRVIDLIEDHLEENSSEFASQRQLALSEFERGEFITLNDLKEPR